VKRYSDAAVLETTVTGAQYFQLSPTIPSSLYNTSLALKGFKLCYDANDYTGTFIDMIQVMVYSYSNTVTISATVTDETNLADVGCRVVNLAAPVNLKANDQVTILLKVSFANTFHSVKAYATTALLTPTTQVAVLEGDLLAPLADPAPGDGLPTEYRP
jgi:hypothetical protein